jgi:DNA-binding transcriptional ArsR family regulator
MVSLTVRRVGRARLNDSDVTIAFRLPASAAERVALSYSPTLEAVLSLHVLVEPKHHPLQHGWVRAMQKLPPALKREIDALAFAYRAYFPEFFFPSPSGSLLSFADELAALRAVDPELLRREYAIPFVGDGPIDPLRVPAAVIDDPVALHERVLALLEAYWEAAFAEEWKRIEPDLAASVAEAGRQIASVGVYGLLRGLFPEVRCDAVEGRFWLERPHDHEVTVGPGQTLVLAPSAYVWPHVRVSCDEPWPFGLVFPASSITREARPRIPPAQLVGVLRALADDTRLRALRLIAERPRSTQELAPLVGITEAALSKHLRALADAGLLERRREGYYVLYRLVEEQLDAVAPSLDGFLRDTTAQ